MLTNNQKKIIAKKHKYFSANNIANSLSVNTREVELYIKSITQNKTPKWFVFVLVLLPFFLILLLEFGLRVSNYGNDFTEWIDLNNKYEILNPEIANKYFNGISNVPFSTESFLLKQKPKNSFRIIALGASTGAGFPYQNASSFTKYIRKGFQYAFPNEKVEVANISMAAINSYTILDLLPNVIEKQPDQIIIYLGHNEYYGALGAGSIQSFGGSRTITNFVLSLKDFKIFQLMESLINYTTSLFNGKTVSDNKTLMAKMAKEKIIKYQSEEYFKGIDQFKGNLSEIFEMCKTHKIPVLVGTLTSNLKDLKPFATYENAQEYSARSIFNQATIEYNDSNFITSDSLYRLAKDLDGLRFRAPEDFNKIIKKLASEFDYPVVDIDSSINANSINGIVGNELMIDHLHPNISGYQLMGQSYFESILYNHFSQNINLINLSAIDSTVKANYHFTKYDSAISNYRIKILKNDWPFQKRLFIKNKKRLLNPKTIEENIAYDVLENKISRYDARLKLAEHYFLNRKYDQFADELLTFVETFPTEKNILNIKSEELIKAAKYNYVEKLLSTSYYMEPDVFNTKWLGIMNVSNNNIDIALGLLEQSYNFNKNDPQVLFNLSGIFLQKQDYTYAYKYIIDCLKISPNYKNANNVKLKIEYLLKQNNK